MTNLAALVGMRQACAAIGIARATMQRRVKPRLRTVAKSRARSERALTDEERAAADSSHGTTPSIATPESLCSRLRTFTSVELINGGKRAAMCFRRHTRATQIAS